MSHPKEYWENWGYSSCWL